MKQLFTKRNRLPLVSWLWCLLPTQIFLTYLPEMWKKNPHCFVRKSVCPKLDITHHWTESQRENQSNWNAWRQNNYQENVKRSDQNTQEVYQEVESSNNSHQNARRWSWNNFDSRGGLHSLKFSKEFAEIPPWTETTRDGYTTREAKWDFCARHSWKKFSFVQHDLPSKLQCESQKFKPRTRQGLVLPLIAFYHLLA